MYKHQDINVFMKLSLLVSRVSLFVLSYSKHGHLSHFSNQLFKNLLQNYSIYLV